MLAIEATRYFARAVHGTTANAVDARARATGMFGNGRLPHPQEPGRSGRRSDACEMDEAARRRV